MTMLPLARAVLSAALATLLSAGTPAVASPVALTNGDHGRAVVVHPGDRITVRLVSVREGGVRYDWDTPTAAAPEVLHRSEGATDPRGSSRAVFTAAQDGSSAVTAHRRCTVVEPGALCSHAVVLWQVTITAE
ncbi:hypothetical protein ABT095_28375 [Kitasatospora sp. NPDC002227]|uniref:hypothetical protein n=1 Tax=Kitasatospora sp. NPDC002227 TaxID=3154773 RepID=UPI003332A1B3